MMTGDAMDLHLYRLAIGMGLILAAKLGWPWPDNVDINAGIGCGIALVAVTDVADELKQRFCGIRRGNSDHRA